jgi:hypothetical protein
VHALQRRAWVAAELVAQPLTVGGVPGESRRGPRRRRLAAQQFGQDLLVVREAQDQLAERCGRLGPPPQPRQRQRAGSQQRPVDRNPRRAQRRQRVAVPRVPALRALAQREPGPGVPQRREVVAGPGPLLTLGRAEQDRGGIDLVLAQREAVSARRTDDDPGAEPGPSPGHKDLEGLDRVLGLLVWPQPVHQPGGAAPHVRVLGQERKQALQPGAGNLQAAITNPPQQGQLNGHRHQISRSPARRRG